MGNLSSRLIVELIDRVSGPAKGMASSVAGISKAAKTLDQIADFRNLKRGLSDAAQAYKLAQQNARATAAAMAGVEKASRQQQAAMAAAQREVERSKSAFMQQGQAVRAAMSALSAAGVHVNSLASAEGRLRTQVGATNKAMQAQARAAKRREAAGALGAMAGGAAAIRGPQMARTAIESIADFDVAVRQQKVFMDLSKAEQDKLKAQALKIGQETKFTNLDVVHAQTAAMQGMGAKMTAAQKAQAGLGITQAASNFAQMMPGTDLTRSAELLRAYMTAFGKNLSDPVKATAEAIKASNILLKAAKAGGMSAEDLDQYIKFAAASQNAAGINEETFMALGAVARIGGLRGDEAGVMARSMANKLTNPTNPGMTALQAAGIKYSDFVKMPDSLNVENFGGHMQRRLGKKLDAKARSQLAGIFQNKDLLASRDEFTSAVTKAVGHLFAPKKDGSMRSSDARTIAKEAGVFHKVSAGSVDTMGLLNAIFGGKLTFAQASAFFTDKHGGKAMITQQQFDEMKAIVGKLQEVNNDPKFAERGAQEIQGGVGGEVNRFKGSLETMYLKVGEANEGLIKFAATVGGQALDSFSNASAEVRQFTSAIVAAGAAFGAFKTVGMVKDLLTGGGAAIALDGSAAALTKSALALDAAAVRLGAAPGASALTGATAPAAAAAAGAGWAGIFGAGVVAAFTGWAGNLFAGNPLDIGLTPEQAKAKNDKRRALEAGNNRGGSSAAQDAELKRRLSMRDMDGAFGPVAPAFTSNLAQARGEIQGMASDATKLESALGFTAAPKVDKASIDEAMRAAERLKSLLDGVSVAARNAASTVKRAYADYGVSE